MVANDLNRLTKAELVARLEAAEADAETKALAGVVKALEPLAKRRWVNGEYVMDYSLAGRVLHLARVRFGLE